MSDFITTLHPDNEVDVNLYPNIKKENIPNGAVTTEKIYPKAITIDKLDDTLVDYFHELGGATQEQVNEWLDNHPEATTSVEDHSLSKDKLIIGTMGYITPEMFGAVGDGITDDTNALISCLSYKNIELTANKTYLISDSLTLGDNICIKGNNATLSFINVTTNIDEQAVDGACIYITGNNVTLKDINFIGDNAWIRRPYTWESNFDAWYTLRVKTKSLFTINGCDKLFLENLNSKGFRNQFVMRNTTNFKINNCYVNETLADGFFIGYGCSNGIITNCQGEKTDDDFISVTADGSHTDLLPHDIIADGNRCNNCWGAYFCTEGTYNVSCLNGFASDIHFKPLKFGEFNVRGVIINSGLQIFSNITILLNETIQGDSNENLESVACGLGANVDVIFNNVTFIKPLDAKPMLFYINGGKVTLKNSTFTGGSWWFRALTLLNLDNNTFNPNGRINFTGENAIIKNNVFNKDFSTYTGIIEINTTNATFVKNTLIGYSTTYPITSSSTTLLYEGLDLLDGNSVGTIKNDTISTSARVSPSKMLSGFVYSNSKLYACIGGNKYVITMTYES